MKKLLLISILLPLIAYEAIGQSFDKKIDSISKNTTGVTTKKLFIKSSTSSDSTLKSYSVVIDVDKTSSTFPEAEYSLDYSKVTVNELVENKKLPFYITISKDSLPDRQRFIILLLKITGMKEGTSHTQTTDTMIIFINGIEKNQTPNDTLSNYKYLAYIGTNFDLVDGIKAKNLFFAVNIYSPSKRSKGTGMYLSLYGNRTMSATDSAISSIRNYRIDRINDSTSVYYRENSKLNRTRVSDNLGAYFSPIIKLYGSCKKRSWDLSGDSNSTKLFYSPSFEFVWRRTHTTYSYYDGKPLDSIVQTNAPQNIIPSPNNFTIYSNEYIFNFGAIGLFITHENENLSLRIHGSVGLSSTYSPINQSTMATLETQYRKDSDYFFSGRAWITERTTGLTIQAEVVNTYKKPRPFYVVTLSKAIDFKTLGTIFTPISSR